MDIKSPADLPELHLNDIVTLRKGHPCGSFEWRIVRLGADIGLRCVGCDHKVLLTRRKLAKSVKRIVSAINNDGEMGEEK